MPTTDDLSAAPPSVRLTCEAETAGGILHVRYRFENMRDEVLHVFDDLGRSTDANLVCDVGGGAALVLVGVPPLPPFPSYWKFHPKTTALAQGQSVARALTLLLPLREMSAYFGRKYEPVESVPIRVIVLRVDFLADSKVRRSDFSEPRGDLEHALCEAPLAEVAELLRRNDQFGRIQR